MTAKDNNELPNKRALGEAIRESLSQSGRTVTGLARDLGLQRPTVAAWIRRNTFPEDQIPRLVKASDLGVAPADVNRRYEFLTAGWSWAGAGKPRRPRAQIDQTEINDAGSYIDWIGSLSAGDWLLQTVPDGVPEEWREMISGSGPMPITVALRCSLEAGAGLLYLLPTTEQAEAWERAFGIGPAPNAEGLLQSWVRRCGLSEDTANRVRLRRISDTPIFTAGVGVTGQLSSGPNGWRVTKGVIEYASPVGAATSAPRHANLPPLSARILVSLATQELLAV